MEAASQAFITTISGIQFFPFDPKPEQIRIEDIAHALSLCNRFTGHTVFPYSVAQHSLLVADIVEEWEYGPYTQLAALLHDASEAYLVDVPSPVKQRLPLYKSAEYIVSSVINAKYVIHPEAVFGTAIKHANSMSLSTEVRDVHPVAVFSELSFPPHSRKIQERHWQNVRGDFLRRFEQLQKEVK